MVARVFLMMVCLSAGVFAALTFKSTGSNELLEQPVSTTAHAKNVDSKAAENSAVIPEEVRANTLSSSPASNLGSTSQLLTKLAPAKTDIVLICRPIQLLNSEFKPFANEYAQAGGAELQREMEDIELLMIATSEATIRNLLAYDAARAFREIADQLVATDKKTISKSRELEPTRINYLNEDITGLVRFRTPVQWDVVKGWICADKDFRGEFQVQEFDGYEVLASDAKNTCVVCKLDQRTFVVGNKKQLFQAMKSTQPSSQKVSKWLGEYRNSDFEGEFFAAMTKSRRSIFNGMPIGDLEVIERIKDAQVALDLKNDKLLDLKLEFNAVEDAKQFTSMVSSFVGSMKRNFEGVFDADGGPLKTVPGDDYQVWRLEQNIALINSLRFENVDSTFELKIPRPKNLGLQFRRHIKQQKQWQQQFERRAKENPVQLGKVFVAARDIQHGEVISAADFKAELWPKELVPDGAVSDQTAILNRKWSGSIRRNAPFMERDFVQ